jgi:hypothetical protein
MAKVVCVLYDDPVDGYPKKYARDDIPKITKYPDGQTAPTPSAIDFKPGELLGSVSGELGLRMFLEKAGHTLVVTSSKDGKDSVLDRRVARRGDRDLAALLAGLYDQGALRQERTTTVPDPFTKSSNGPRRAQRWSPEGHQEQAHSSSGARASL